MESQCDRFYIFPNEIEYRMRKMYLIYKSRRSFRYRAETFRGGVNRYSDLGLLNSGSFGIDSYAIMESKE